MADPIAVRVTRYRCPHCGRGHSTKARAVVHIARCWTNPQARGCKTCRHFGVSFDGAEICYEGVSLAGSQHCPHCHGFGDIPNPVDLGMSECQECGGNGGTDGPPRKPGPIVHCDQWEAGDG